jgi:hypothetical protein
VIINMRNFIFCLKIQHIFFMAHLGVINLPELLERILYFLAVDKSLYPALFVSRLWYRCGAPILWRRVELKTSNTQKIFMKIIREEQKPVYCSNVTHLEIPNYHLSDKEVKSIVGLFPNIVHLDLYLSVGFSDKTLNRIAESYPNLKYLNLGGYGVGSITDKGLYAIVNSCHKLEYLNISERKGISEIAIWNVIHSCPQIQHLDIYKCNITYTTFEEIGLYLKLKYINPGTATRYLEKIGRSRTCFSTLISRAVNNQNLAQALDPIRRQPNRHSLRNHFNRVVLADQAWWNSTDLTNPEW